MILITFENREPKSEVKLKSAEYKDIREKAISCINAIAINVNIYLLFVLLLLSALKYANVY